MLFLAGPSKANLDKPYPGFKNMNPRSYSDSSDNSEPRPHQPSIYDEPLPILTPEEFAEEQILATRITPNSLGAVRRLDTTENLRKLLQQNLRVNLQQQHQQHLYESSESEVEDYTIGAYHIFTIFLPQVGTSESSSSNKWIRESIF